MSKLGGRDLERVSVRNRTPKIRATRSGNNPNTLIVVKIPRDIMIATCRKTLARKFRTEKGL